MVVTGFCLENVSFKFPVIRSANARKLAYNRVVDSRQFGEFLCSIWISVENPPLGFSSKRSANSRISAENRKADIRRFTEMLFERTEFNDFRRKHFVPDSGHFRLVYNNRLTEPFRLN